MNYEFWVLSFELQLLKTQNLKLKTKLKILRGVELPKGNSTKPSTDV